MAVTLCANYSKKIGLPKFSSHSFMVSVEVELSDLSQVEKECERLYTMLQQSVDRELQQVGYLPEPKPKSNHCHEAQGRNGHSYAFHQEYEHDNTRVTNLNHERWECTEGQRGLILRLIHEHQLAKPEVEALAVQLFHIGVKHLNKAQASQLIDELLIKVGKVPPSSWRGSRAQAAA